jgi:hypothetical protein
MTIRTAATGATFSSLLGARSDEYRASSGDEGQRSRENWPLPTGLRRKSAMLCCRPRPWSHQRLPVPPRLAEFSHVTLLALIVLTGPKHSADLQLLDSSRQSRSQNIYETRFTKKQIPHLCCQSRYRKNLWNLISPRPSGASTGLLGAAEK